RGDSPYLLVSPDPYVSPKLSDVRKLDAAGATVWTRAFPAAWPANPSELALGGTGDLYLAGDTGGALPGHTEYLGAGDVFLLKMNPSVMVTFFGCDAARQQPEGHMTEKSLDATRPA